MNSGCLETSISRQNIVDQVAAFLYAIKVVPEDVDITDIQFPDTFLKDDATGINIKIYTEGRC